MAAAWSRPRRELLRLASACVLTQLVPAHVGAVEAAGGEAVKNKAVPPAELADALPEGQLQGSARLRFFGLDIYQARLWAGRGFQSGAYAQQPFALELLYLRALSGKLIAERSIKEMRR